MMFQQIHIRTQLSSRLSKLRPTIPQILTLLLNVLLLCLMSRLIVRDPLAACKYRSLGL
jgi:hypothetical protein